MKHIKHLLIFVLLLASCRQDPTGSVVVIDKTNSYHRAGCAKVNMAETTTMSIDSAIAHHMKPCPYCKPDKGI